MESRAQSGYQNADSYDQNRPTYPIEAVENLLNQLSIAGVAQATIVEVGAGTGKFTEILASRAEKYRIVAVEPHPDMRGVLTQKRLVNTHVADHVASNMSSVVSNSADAVLVAQAFNWFATRETLEEFHRVLKPQAKLGLVWNVDDYCAPPMWQPETEHEATLKAIIHALPNPVNQFRQESWPACFHETSPPLFARPTQWSEHHWTIGLSEVSIWERIQTMSQVAVLEDSMFQNVKGEIHKALAKATSEDINQNGIQIHGRTVCYCLESYPIPASIVDS